MVHDDATLFQFLDLLSRYLVAFHIDKHLVTFRLQLCFELLDYLATILVLAKLLVRTALAAYIHAVRSTKYDNFLFHFLVVLFRCTRCDGIIRHCSMRFTAWLSYAGITLVGFFL